MDQRIDELMRQLEEIENKSAALRLTIQQETEKAMRVEQEAKRQKEEAERIMAKAEQTMAEAQAKRQAAEQLMTEVLEKQKQAETMMKEAVALVDKAKQMREEIAFISQPTEEEFVEVEPTDEVPVMRENMIELEPNTANTQNEGTPAEPIQQESTSDITKETETAKGSGNMIGEMKIDNIRAAISLGDRFYFQRELFGGNGELMTKTISALNACASLQEAENYISRHFNWDTGTEAYEHFYNILKRRW